MATDFKYEVLEECLTLDQKEYLKQGKPTKEILRLRYIKWNEAQPKYDLRWWVYTGKTERCGKGVPLKGEHLLALVKGIIRLNGGLDGIISEEELASLDKS